MKNILKLLTLTGLVAGFTSFASADTTWNVDATFSYNSLGNVATGSFTLDSSLNLTSWDVTVSGTNVAADNVYNPGDSIPIFPDLTHLDFYDGTTNQYIDLYFQSALNSGPGIINLLYGDGGQSNNATIVCAGCGTLDEGFVSTGPVPEPTSIYLLGCGAGMLGLGLLRRKFFARM